MKKFFMIALALLLFQQWERVHDYFIPPKDYSYLQGIPLTLYSTQWCRYCAKTRHFLERHHIAYSDFDIEKSKQARAEFDALGGGGVPLLLVNGQKIRGYDPELILRYLDQVKTTISP